MKQESNDALHPPFPGHMCLKASDLLSETDIDGTTQFSGTRSWSVRLLRCIHSYFAGHVYGCITRQDLDGIVFDLDVWGRKYKHQIQYFNIPKFVADPLRYMEGADLDVLILACTNMANDRMDLVPPIGTLRLDIFRAKHGILFVTYSVVMCVSYVCVCVLSLLVCRRGIRLQSN